MHVHRQAVRAAGRQSLHSVSSLRSRWGVDVWQKNALGRVKKAKTREKLNRLFKDAFPLRRWVLVESKAMQFSHGGNNYFWARRLVSSIFYWRYDMKGFLFPKTASHSAGSSLRTKWLIFNLLFANLAPDFIHVWQRIKSQLWTVTFWKQTPPKTTTTIECTGCTALDS